MFTSTEELRQTAEPTTTLAAAGGISRSRRTAESATNPRRLAESRGPGGRRNQPQIRGGWRNLAFPADGGIRHKSAAVGGNHFCARDAPPVLLWGVETFVVFMSDLCCPKISYTRCIFNKSKQQKVSSWIAWPQSEDKFTISQVLEMQGGNTLGQCLAERGAPFV